MNRETPDEEAVPAVYQEDDSSGTSFTLEVDGHLFEVTLSGTGDSNYTWLTGPNPGYGFGEHGPGVRSLDDHRNAIRSFLEQIDPATGYLSEG